MKTLTATATRSGRVSAPSAPVHVNRQGYELGGRGYVYSTNGVPSEHWIFDPPLDANVGIDFLYHFQLYEVDGDPTTIDSEGWANWGSINGEAVTLVVYDLRNANVTSSVIEGDLSAVSDNGWIDFGVHFKADASPGLYKLVFSSSSVSDAVIYFNLTSDRALFNIPTITAVYDLTLPLWGAQWQNQSSGVLDLSGCYGPGSPVPAIVPGMIVVGDLSQLDITHQWGVISQTPEQLAAQLITAPPDLVFDVWYLSLGTPIVADDQALTHSSDDSILLFGTGFDQMGRTVNGDNWSTQVHFIDKAVPLALNYNNDPSGGSLGLYGSASARINSQLHTGRIFIEDFGSMIVTPLPHRIVLLDPGWFDFYDQPWGSLASTGPFTVVIWAGIQRSV